MQPNIKLIPALVTVFIITMFLLAFFEWYDINKSLLAEKAKLRIEKVENPIRAKEVDYEKITFNDDEGLWLPLKNFPQDVPIVGVTVLYEWKEPKE